MQWLKNTIKRYLGITGLKDRIDEVVKEVVAKAIKDQTTTIARSIEKGYVPMGGETKELSRVLTKLVKESTTALADKKVIELVADAIEATGINEEEFLDGVVVRLKAKQLT